MKIKMMFFALAGGILLASCSDKAAEQKIADLEKSIAAKDSACTAQMTMMTDSIASLNAMIMEMSAPKNTTSSNTGSKTTTTTKTEPKIGEGKFLENKKTDVNVKTGDNKKLDIKTKGGATGGN